MASHTISNPILVTGATGRHGGTGAHVVRALRAAGRSVRVLARQESERTEALQSFGAEIVVGDYADRKSLICALDGVASATFTYPIAPGAVEAAATFASAARHLGTPLRVVVPSMAPAHPESPSHLGRAQWLAEEVLAWAGLDLCVLRIAAVFFENIPILHGVSIRGEGLIRNSFGSTDVPWISGQDAAALVVAALLHPRRFDAGSIHYPPGAELFSHAAAADVLTQEFGRPIQFEPVSKEAWTTELEELADSDPRGPVNADMARHIAAVGAALAGSVKGPIRAPDIVELQRLTGQPPLTFADFIRNERHHFEGTAHG